MLNKNFTKDKKLQQRINTTFGEVFELPEKDYYGLLDLEKLLKLKSALSDINHAISMQLAFEFLMWLSNALSLNEEEILAIRKEILKDTPKSSFHDIEYHSLIQGKSFIAEIKCKLPLIEGNKYGGAQKSRILKDITALHDSHTKAPVPYVYKFIVFLDRQDVRDANNYLISSCPKLAQHFKIIENIESLPLSTVESNNVVYGVYIKLGT